MGRIFSKHQSKQNKRDVKLQKANKNKQEEEEEEEEKDEVYDPEEYDLETVKYLKEQFKEDPEMFILNMLLMSFMFFEDYPKEITKLIKASSERGKRLNSELIRDHQKQILMPNSILEGVNKRIKILLPQGSNKGLMQPLAPQRMFVLDDAIEIEDKNVVVGYSRIDKPLYRAHFEESREHKGYVKVNLLEAFGKKLEDNSRSPSVDSACSTMKEGGESSVSNNNSTDENLKKIHGNESGYTSESTYDYRRITAARIPQKLSVSKTDICTETNGLPSRCINTVMVKNEESYLNEAEDTDENKAKTHEIPLFRSQYYLNSIEFMGHFKNNTFPNHLGEILGFTEESIHQATSTSDAIYCDTLDDMLNTVQWEVIPCIVIPWPFTLANERNLRCIKTTNKTKENTFLDIMWPTQKMVDEINSFNCVVLPKGFLPKRGENPSLHLEWKIEFPKAERYLEFKMSHAQMRIFLYIILLYRYFIEPLTKNHGLSIDHIRTHMFWECESNYLDWPEHKLGTKLKLVLDNLCDRLGKSNLPHYFIRGKNILGNIPRKYIFPAQDIIFRITETPLPYLLLALKHLRYAPGKFYPEPNIEELCEILSRETVLHPEAHLIIVAQEKAQKDEEIKRRNDTDKQDKEQEWNRRRIEQQLANARRLKKQEMQNNKKNLKNDAEKSEKSLVYTFSVKDRLKNNIARQIPLLTFFIQHFLQIARKSFKISSMNQTMFYLKQSWYLTKLLEDIELEKENAKQYQRQIKEEEEKCQRKQVKEPKVPSFALKRNSALFGSDILQVKGRQINKTNLNKSFNSNIIFNEPRPSTSGIKKNIKQKHLQRKVRIEETGNVFHEDIQESLLTKSVIKVKDDKKEEVRFGDICEQKPSTSGIKKQLNFDVDNVKTSLMDIYEEDIKEENKDDRSSYYKNSPKSNINEEITFEDVHKPSASVINQQTLTESNFDNNIKTPLMGILQQDSITEINEKDNSIHHKSDNNEKVTFADIHEPKLSIIEINQQATIELHFDDNEKASLMDVEQTTKLMPKNYMSNGHETVSRSDNNEKVTFVDIHKPKSSTFSSGLNKQIPADLNLDNNEKLSLRDIQEDTKLINNKDNNIQIKDNVYKTVHNSDNVIKFTNEDDDDVMESTDL